MGLNEKMNEKRILFEIGCGSIGRWWCVRQVVLVCSATQSISTKFSSESILALLRYSFYIMNLFEFDLAKSDSNLVKHGIDFVEAQALWGDPMLLEIPAKTEDEPRFLVIGLIEGKHWSAVITYRGVNIRLISVRRARAEEVALYEG
jgi:uncharacterized DUF497 family protein